MKTMSEDLIKGIPVDNLTYDQILSDAANFLECKKKMTVISVNPQIVVESNKYPEVINLIEESSHRIADGIGIILMSRLTNGSIKNRIAGIDVMKMFLDYANNNNKSVFFYGAKPEVITDMKKKLTSVYPNLHIVGSIDGYISISSSTIVEKINKVSPDFLFVALGFPKQEQWIAQNLNKLDVSIIQTVGGSFDVLSGHVKRAPKIFIDLHLEWLYRSIRYPQRLGRIFQLPIFVVSSLIWYLRKGGSN